VLLKRHSATDDINVSETRLEDAKKAFKDTMSLMQAELKELMNRCSRRSIEKVCQLARPTLYLAGSGAARLAASACVDFICSRL
jgi:hypothetical protein